MAASPHIRKAKLMLKPEEIYAISAEISMNYAPLVSAKPAGLAGRIALSSKELLDISQEISRKYMPKLNAATPRFVLLPIDPDHLFASWNLGAAKTDVAAVNQEPRKRDHILRIHPGRTGNPNKDIPDDWFDIALAPGQTRQTIVVPEAYKAASYTAAIGSINHENQFTVLATSKVTYNQPHNKAASSSENNGSSNGSRFKA